MQIKVEEKGLPDHAGMKNYFSWSFHILSVN